tara:strand:+ start:33 stop:596 length:564 start_codon:yes stop_codon:yes gene_type:complete
MFFYFFQYNNLFLIIAFLLVFFNFSVSHSQVLESDVILEEVDLISKMPYTKSEYFYYKKKVFKVHRYLDTIRNIISDLDGQLVVVQKKRKRKKLIKNYKKDLMERFTTDIKSLTRKEGVILSKLVHRELEASVFDIIKRYKGNWSAFWWQNLAKLYDGDINSQFNPKKNKEDFLIEKILSEYFSDSL